MITIEQIATKASELFGETIRAQMAEGNPVLVLAGRTKLHTINLKRYALDKTSIDEFAAEYLVNIK